MDDSYRKTFPSQHATLSAFAAVYVSVSPQAQDLLILPPLTPSTTTRPRLHPTHLRPSFPGPAPISTPAPRP